MTIQQSAPSAPPKPIYLKDYQRPAFIVNQIDLTFNLDDQHTIVHSRMDIQR
jgi:aminopeptidase N